MVDRLGMRRKRPAHWRVAPQAVPRMIHALYETAWASAWPHLDDWFKDDGFNDRDLAQSARKARARI